MTTFQKFTMDDIPLILSLMRQFNAIDNYPFDETERTENLKYFSIIPITENSGSSDKATQLPATRSWVLDLVLSSKAVMHL